MSYYGNRDCYGLWSLAEEKVADDWTKAKAKRSFLWRLFSCCSPKCFQIRCVCTNVWMLVILFCLLAVILIVLGVVVVLPFTRTMDYWETTCYVVKASNNTQRLRCGCGKHCSSHYPCLEMYVNYTRFDDTQVVAMLHENERFGPCTYKPKCRKDERRNIRRVEEYQDLYGHGQYSCRYNPEVGSPDVLRTYQLTVEGMIHTLFWPSLVIFLCILGLVVIGLTCGFTYVCKCTPPQDVKDAAREQEETYNDMKNFEGYASNTVI